MFGINCVGRKTFRVFALALGMLLVVFATRVFAAPPIDLSTVNQYNQLSFSDANLVNSYVYGQVAYGGDASFNMVSLATSFFNAPCPTGNAVIEVGGSVNYAAGTIFGGSGRYGTTLTTGTQVFDCNQDSWSQAAPSVDIPAVKSQLTALSSSLATAASTGPTKIRDCYLSASRTTSDLNVYNIDGDIFENTDPNRYCIFSVEAPCSATVLINVSGTNINLTNFDLALGNSGLAPSQILVNFYEAQTLNLSDVQINGTILAPLATVTGAVSNTQFNRVIGGLFAQELSGQFNSELAPFVAGPQNGCELRYDFGDLPNNYSVNLLENGARHEIGNLFLGNAIDDENDGQPTIGADGDTIGDDGIITNPENWSSDVANGGSLMTFANGDGCVNGWVDWNEDGDFDDANEHIVVNEPVNTVGSTVNFNVQYVPMGEMRYARFRLTERVDVNGQMLCTDTIVPTGFYKNGEVEDYRYIFADATAVQLSSAETTPAPIALIALTAILLSVATGIARRKVS